MPSGSHGEQRLGRARGGSRYGLLVKPQVQLACPAAEALCERPLRARHKTTVPPSGLCGGMV